MYAELQLFKTIKMRSRYQLIFLLPVLFFTTVIHGQEPSYEATSYIDENGNIFWNKKLPIYLKISSSPEGGGTLLKSNNSKYTNPLFLDTEGTNYIRTRYAVDNETGKTVQPLAEVMMPIIADSEGPETNISYSGAVRYRKNGVTYFGPGLKVSLASEDKLSGLNVLNYKLNDGSYLSYAGEMTIEAEQEHTFQYFGVDRVGNSEKLKESKFIVDLTPPLITHNINGFADNNIIANPSTIYFTSEDNLSGVNEIYYRFDDASFKKYNGNNVPFTSLEDGDHLLEYYATDNVGNKTATYSLSIYYDKTAPLTASDVLGDRYVVNNKVYFSGRTKMKLTAVDNKVGVKEIKYSIDNEKFKIYDQPFYLPSIQGEHSIRFYSVDRLANEPSGSEKYKHNISLVILDLTGPTVTGSFSGPTFNIGENQFIGPSTKLSLNAEDRESGVQYVAYSINGAAAENTYTDPITFSESGKYSLELFGYDNVNNRNINSMEFYVDNDSPEIIENFSTEATGSIDNENIYPSYVTVYLAATDNLTGNDRIYYRINGGKESLYTRPISNLKKDEKYTLEVRAIDKVGNESQKTVIFRTNND